MRLMVCSIGVLLMASLSSGQTVTCPPLDANPVRNPTRARWTQSVDHADVATYTMDVYSATDGLQKAHADLGLGVEDPNVPGDREETFNGQVLKFGQYCAVLYAIGTNGEQSDPSEPSNSWLRVPGKPSNATVQ